MKWLLTRLTIVCLIMGVLCAAAVGAGRLDHSLSKLQALGIDACGGVPCFKGISSGTEWSTLQKMFPDAAFANGILYTNNLSGFSNVYFWQSTDGPTVDSIVIWVNTADQTIPVYAGDVIAQLGEPCAIEMASNSGQIILTYPKIIFAARAHPAADGNLLLPESPISQVDIRSRYALYTCSGNDRTRVGPWHGFITDRDYVNRNRRDLGYPLLPSDGP